MSKKRTRVTRYYAQVRLSNAGRPDTLPGQPHDTTGLTAADIATLIRLGALTAQADSLPNDPVDPDEDTTT